MTVEVEADADDAGAGGASVDVMPAVGMTDRVRTVGHLTTLPLTWLVAAFTLAQLADVVSALVVARELNPIVASIVERPLLAVALKLGLIALVVAVAEICDRRRPLLARVVLLIGTIAGVLGALSNTHLTPFVSG